MSCRGPIDLDDPESPECGDEGRLCDSCQEEAAREHAWLRNVPAWVVKPRDDDYYQELRDAGRL